jgi:hypothetical protein
MFDAIFLIFSRLDWLNAQVRLIHDEVVTVETMPGSLCAIERHQRFGSANRWQKAGGCKNKC